jgi:putative alpha-1,2-mannosidase
VKSAISYVSVDGALNNLRSENPDWDFDSRGQSARQAWNDVLARARVSGGSDEAMTVYYTALYHTFLHPNLFSDVDGSYRGFDDLVHRAAEGHAHYHNIPGWDQYRALIQWRAMLDPERTSDIIQSLVDDALQGGGGMPRWEQANRNSNGMIGDAPGAYVASAYAFGARSFDARAALRALDLAGSTVGTTSGGHPVREHLADWLAQGYVPDQPSISLEYAASDFGIAQLAQALGEQAMADRYLRRAYGWQRAFDTARPDAVFVEGNVAQYTWMVPFDVPGVADRLGGRDVAMARLDDFFTELNAGPNRPHAWLGNQPSLWAPWAYAALGAPWKTHAVVRRIQSELFSATPGGLPGNDDGGTLSSWYVLSALGLFPAVPGVDSLVIGSPVFGDAVLDLGNGHTVHVVARGTGPYVSAVRLNGEPYVQTTIAWRELQDAVLEIDRSVDEPVLAERDQE